VLLTDVVKCEHVCPCIQALHEEGAKVKLTFQELTSKPHKMHDNFHVPAALLPVTNRGYGIQ
jgi:hypothetical protein